MTFSTEDIDWNKVGGLVPLIVQDARNMRVLMLGFANREALRLTLETGLVTFYSRTKQRLWKKGESSGNVLRLRELRLDCDRDTVLALAEPQGNTCHMNMPSCFGDEGGPSLATFADFLERMDASAIPYDPDFSAIGFGEDLQRIGEMLCRRGSVESLPEGLGADLISRFAVFLKSSGMKFDDVLAKLGARKPLQTPNRRVLTICSPP